MMMKVEFFVVLLPLLFSRCFRHIKYLHYTRNGDFGQRTINAEVGIFALILPFRIACFRTRFMARVVWGEKQRREKIFFEVARSGLGCLMLVCKNDFGEGVAEGKLNV